MNFNPADFRYFFVSFAMGGGAFGNTIMRQGKDAAHTEDHGLNIASASEMLLTIFPGTPALLMNWEEVTYHRYMDWYRYSTKLQGTKPTLSSIDGGKAGVDASAGPTDVAPKFHVVRCPDAKKPDPAS